MSKTICLGLAIITMAAVKVNAQEKVLLDINYKFSFIRDLADKDHPYVGTTVLSVGKSSTRYCSERTFKRNDPKLMRARAEQQRQAALQSSSSKTAIAVVGSAAIVVTNNGAFIDEEILKDSVGLWSLNAVVGTKIYKCTLPAPIIKWKMINEKKEIKGYLCQKAVGDLGGRTYTVWYAPELPFKSGPWKLNGLPGLILEGTDSKGEVAFVAEKIQNEIDPDETTRPYLSSARSVKTELNDYVNLKMQYESDPETTMSAFSPNSKVNVINIDDPNATSVKKIKKYNPIEKK